MKLKECEGQMMEISLFYSLPYRSKENTPPPPCFSSVLLLFLEDDLNCKAAQLNVHWSFDNNLCDCNMTPQ